VRRRALGLALVLAAALAQSACGNRESIRGGGATVGTTLTIYSSLPSPARGSARDIVEGQKLALAAANGRAGKYTINFSSLDEAGENPRRRMRRAAEAARIAMADTQTAALIGSVDSAGARASIPLLNAAGFLHVSLGAGYPGFTGRLGAGEPQRWFPAGGRTFARVVGDDRAQAPVLVRAAETRRVVVEAEGGEDAAALAAEVRRAAAAAGVKVVDEAGRGSAVIYAGEEPVVAASIARETPGVRVVLGDALVRNGVEGLLEGAVARRAVLVSSAPEPGSTPALREFEAAFERAYGRRPGPYAALGHAAMETVLAALDRAAADDEAGRRRRVLREYFSAGARDTVAGPLPVLASGAAAQPHFTAFRLSNGRRGYLREP